MKVIFTNGPLLRDLDLEMRRGELLHGAIPADQNRAFVVLAREVGEVADALPHPNSTRKEQDPASLRAELIQVAAVAIRWVQQIDEDQELQEKS